MRRFTFSLLLALMLTMPAIADDRWNHQQAAMKAFGAGNIPGAVAEMQKAIEIAEKSNDKSNVPSMYGNIGAFYRAANNYSEAIKYLDLALSGMRKSKKPDEFLISSTLNNLGECYRAAGQGDKAIPPLLEAKSMIPPQHSLYPTTLQNLGMAYVVANKNEEAEKTFKEAISLSESKDPRVAVESMYSLSLLYAKQGRAQELSSLLDKGIALSKNSFGEDNPRTQKLIQMKTGVGSGAAKKAEWESHMNQGQAAMKEKDYLLALTHYELALKIIEPIAPDAPMTGIVLTSLGAVYMHINRFSNAIEALNKAVPIYRAKFTSQPEEIEAVEKMLALAKTMQERK